MWLSVERHALQCSISVGCSFTKGRRVVLKAPLVSFRECTTRSALCHDCKHCPKRRSLDAALHLTYGDVSMSWRDNMTMKAQ
jgi:hypothetical protein